MAKKSKQSVPANPGEKRRYGDINAEKLVTAALNIVRRDGAMKLSMRTLAAELDLSTMAAYYYVPSKEALIDLVMDRVYSAISIANIPGSPEEKLRGLFWQCLDVMSQYPGLPLLAVLDHESRELTRLLAELQEVFKDAGYSDHYTDSGFLLMALFSYGAIMLESGIGTGLAIHPGQNIRKVLDDGLSLIFAGLKTFGEMESLKQVNSGALATSKSKPPLGTRRSRKIPSNR